MIGADLLRGTVDLLILDALLDEPSYGYAVSKRIEERSGGQYALRETTLYSAMRRLEKSGALESYEGLETQGRARTYYRVTDAGARLYEDKCREWRTAVDVVSRFVRGEA